MRDNVCELIPDQIVSRWDLTEVSHSTENDLIGVGRCAMADGASRDVTLDLRLTSYSGGDADSADGFAADDRAETCAGLSAAHAANGTVAEGESSCTVSFSADGNSSTIKVSEVPETFGVVRIEMRAARSDAEQVEAAVEDAMSAVEAGLVASASENGAI